MKLWLLFVALLLSVLLSLQASAQGWFYSGPFTVGDPKCGDPGQPPCPTGQYCFNFECTPCTSSPGACQTWDGYECDISNQADGSGCGGSNFCKSGSCVSCATAGDGAICNPSGWGCSGGTCINCGSAGAVCTADSGCCGGTKCDLSNGRCVACDVNKVQTNPAALYGGGKCEASCGASSQCDELTAGGFAASGKCTSQCLYYDGDTSQAACDSSIGTGNWNLGTGSEVAAAACCGDDAGEHSRFKDCAPGVCVDNLADKKCCNADADCVYNGQCFDDVNAAVAGIVAENAGFCAGKNENACTSGQSKVKCQWTGGSCVAAATRAAVQFSQQSGGSYASYADVNGDGNQEVCLAASPGQWTGSSGSISGVVRNVTDVVSGALVRVLGVSPPLTATSAADGSYAMENVPTGDHDVAASKSGYEAGVNYVVPVYDGGVTVSDFTLVQALGDCGDDCMKVGSNLCDASCHGKGLCWFYSEEVRAACDGTFGIIEMPGGIQNVDCCKGKPYTPIKAEATVPSKNVIVSRMPVLYHGKFVNMVMVVFNR